MTTSEMISSGASDQSITWELVCVARTETAQAAHRWNASLYCRHGGDLFPGWWKHSRGKPWFEKLSHLCEDEFSNWDVCVYVRRSTTDFRLTLAYILYTRRSLHLPFLHNGKGSYLRRDYTAVMPTPYYPIQHVVLCYAIPSEDTHPPLPPPPPLLPRNRGVLE